MNVLVEGPRADRWSASPKRCANGSTIAATCWCAARSIGSPRSTSGSRCSAALLIAYLNLDEVIRIIRTRGRAQARADEDASSSPRCRPTPSSTCGCATCASSRKWRSGARTRTCATSARSSRRCSARKTSNGRRSPARSRKVRDTFGPKTPLGKRRTEFRRAPEHDAAAIDEAMVEREPVTVVVSEKGWIRALRGHVSRSVQRRVQERRRAEILPSPPRRHRSVWCSRPTAASTRSMPRSCPAGADMASRYGSSSTSSRTPMSVSVFRHQGGRKFLVASEHGRGFVVAGGRLRCQHPQGQAGAEREAARRGGRDVRASRATWSPSIGENRKMVIFPIDQVPEMAPRRGRAAAALQGRRPVGRDDLRRQGRPDLARRAGRSLHDALKELSDWRGNRADAGRLAPKGFPKSEHISDVNVT